MWTWRSRPARSAATTVGRVIMRGAIRTIICLLLLQGCKHADAGHTKVTPPESGCRFVELDGVTRVERVGDAGCPLVDGLSGGQGIAPR